MDREEEEGEEKMGQGRGRWSLGGGPRGSRTEKGQSLVRHVPAPVLSVKPGETCLSLGASSMQCRVLGGCCVSQLGQELLPSRVHGA